MGVRLLEWEWVNIIKCLFTRFSNIDFAHFEFSNNHLNITQLHSITMSISSNIWQNNWLIEKSHLPHYKHVRIDSKAIFFFSNGVVLMAAFAIEVRGKIFTFLTFSKQWRNIFKSPSGQIRYKRMTNNMVWKKIIQSGLYLRHQEYSYCRPIFEITPIPKVVLPF